MNIIQKPSPNFKEGRGIFTKPEIIVIHIMAGSLAGTDSWFANSISQVSSHYGVGFNGEIHQYVKEEDTAWTQGLKVPPINKPLFKLYKEGFNPNQYCIGIENEGEDLAKAPIEQLNALVSLIRTISTRWGIPIDREHIIGHYEVDPVRKPFCPSPDKSILDKIVKMASPTIDKTAIKKQIIELLNQL